MARYSAQIIEYTDETPKVLLSGSYEKFKDLELALERGLKCSVIPRKKAAPKKKAKK